MPGLRDHKPFVIEQFGGLWARGDSESAPSDHFIQADNVKYFHSGVETRDPLDKYSLTSIGHVRRIYDYVMQNGQSLLVLTDGGNIYHVIPQNPALHITKKVPTPRLPAQVVHGPILTIPAMEDFGFVAINGKAYITPFKSYLNAQGLYYELGIQNEFLYVYKGDGIPARKAAGVPPVGTPLVAALGAAGATDIGVHLIAVVYETDTGYVTALGPAKFAQLNFSGVNKINVSNIPVSPNSFVKKRHLVSTKAITDYNGDQTGYQFFFIPGGNIENNTATTHTVEYFDSDLLSDASHLIDNFSEIPAGVNLNTYHSRLVVVGEYGTAETLTGLPTGITDNRSVARLSMPGEPEAFNKIDGLIIAPLDGNPLTNVQEFRDVLYLFKRSRTYAYSDNRDEPATWQEEVVDQGVGCPVHGIATVLDTGGANIDFLLIADSSGLMIFNGVYARPELTWKIEDYWLALDHNGYRFIQIVNDSINKKIWITLPTAGPIWPSDERRIVLFADYGDGLDARNIMWARWIFDSIITAACLIETHMLILGSAVQNPGIYYINNIKPVLCDSYYGGDLKIPDPTIRTAFLGE
jgi:hypothetical protein